MPPSMATNQSSQLMCPPMPPPMLPAREGCELLSDDNVLMAEIGAPVALALFLGWFLVRKFWTLTEKRSCAVFAADSTKQISGQLLGGACNVLQTYYLQEIIRRQDYSQALFEGARRAH